MPDNSQRQMHMNAFLMASGHHNAGWRIPGADPRGVTSLQQTIHQARIAEKAKFDSVFFADVLFTGYSLRDTPLTALDAMVMATAVATVTERIGVIATISTEFNDPFNLARRIASLDQLSGGRAAWNCITSTQDVEARNFGFDGIPNHARRYERAEEFIDVVNKLWDSWGPGAYVADAESGVWADTDQITEIDHQGEFFKVRGPLTVPRSPQWRPVIIQAGSSPAGIELASRSADAVFTAQSSLAKAQEFYTTIKDRIVANGRNPDHLLVLPGLSPVIGSTEAEARSLQEQLNEAVTDRWIIGFLSKTMGYEFTEDQLDHPLPADLPDEVQGMVQRAKLVTEVGKRGNLTVRELGRKAGFARGHLAVVGTAEQVADTMEKWFRERGADGFNIMPPVLPTGLETFAEQVVPILQQRGLFRTEYEGSTLRENYGLPIPEHADSLAAV